MKLCIITVYNSVNCGSFLQAYSLGEVLSGLGHNVVYYKIKRNVSPPSRLQILKSFIKNCYRNNLGTAFLRLKSSLLFWYAEKNFKIISEEEENTNPCDVYIFGSDTLWNLDSEHFLKDYDLFWGLRFKDKKKCTYAISLSNVTYEALCNYTFTKQALNEFKGISVRDKHTSDVISKITNRDVLQVCDPTLLVDKSTFKRFEKEKLPFEYCLLYVFHDYDFEETFIDEIKLFCHKRHLKLVSLGEYRKWCDCVLPYSPENFITLFKNASVIFTNTFHGTIFSLIYNVNFVALGDAKIKVNNLLQEYGLENKKYVKGEKLETYFLSKIDFTRVNRIILEKRNISLNYLLECLN